MKIIGGKDYYDSARSWGIDPSIVFVRTGREIESIQLYNTFLNLHLAYTEKNAWPHINTFYVDSKHKETRYELTPVLLFVAGKRYFGIKAHWETKEFGEVNSSKYIIFWNLDRLEGWLATKGVKFAETNLWFQSHNYGKFKNTKGYLEHEFSTAATQKEVDWMIEQRLTIALCWMSDICQPLYSHRREQNKYKWELDSDCLKKVNFWEVMRPTEVYQEIAQWVGGVLPKPGNPMVQITDDKVKIHKAGFDTKLSFRKAKQE